MGRNMEKVVNSDSNNKTLRYERKFIFENILLEDLISTIVYTNPYGFQEIYHQRAVNNIYFDDSELSFYHQNVSGIGLRKKYRLRWYSKDFYNVHEPTFEIKRKYGELGDKYLFKMPKFKVDLEKNSPEDIQKLITIYLTKSNNKELALKLHSLSPALYSSYLRRYFLSSCKKFRITLDYQISFTNTHQISFNSTLKEIVLELKYDEKDDMEARIVSQNIHSRLSKNSKYVRGIDLINNLSSF